jgi:hypothetical protein
MAQFKEDLKKQREAENISMLVSTFMSIAALVYMFVMGMQTDGKPELVTWWMMVPPLGLLAGAMWLIVKPAKMEW